MICFQVIISSHFALNSLFRLNMYTAPAYFMAIIVFITLVLLATYFQDRARHKTQSTQKKSARRTAIDDVANQTTFIGLTTYDCCILGCMLLNVSTKGSIAAFETMGISYANSSFSIPPIEAGVDVASCGTIGVIALLSMGWFYKHFTDIQLIVGGMLIMVVGIWSLTLINDDPDANGKWRFVFAIFMLYSVGYPIGHTALLGLFSKIVGRRPQGTLMGWFASAGSLARIFFPVMAGYVASVDIKDLFIILASILSASAMFVLMSRKKLTLLSS
jgi:ceroid-lipofuscinosis MFS transporter 7